MKPLDLIAAARLLAENPRRGRPPEANLRRAISTAYYALFHCLAENCADMMVGGSGPRRSRDAWLQVYRGLEHGRARQRCGDKNSMRQFSSEVIDIAAAFIEMQDLRHIADYDPLASIPDRDEVIQNISNAEDVIRRFPNALVVERRAFAVHVLMATRRN